MTLISHYFLFVSLAVKQENEGISHFGKEQRIILASKEEAIATYKFKI